MTVKQSPEQKTTEITFTEQTLVTSFHFLPHSFSFGKPQLAPLHQQV